LDMSQRNTVLDSVIIDGWVPEDSVDWLTERRQRRYAYVREPLTLDSVDLQHRVAVEYVSQDDLPILADGQFQATIKEVAEHVRGSVSQHSRGIYFGTLYDPGSRVGRVGDGSTWRSEQEAIAESKELLRQQVKDFADWLKGQGVI
jgi:hypothetical protein